MTKSVLAVTGLAIAVFGGGFLLGHLQSPVPYVSASTLQPVAGLTSSGSQSALPPQQVSPGQGDNEAGRFHPGFAGSLGGSHADGTVTAISGDTVTVKADSDQGQSGEYRNVTTIQLTAKTQYRSCADGSAATTGKSAIKVGSHIIAEGSLSSDGKTLTAAAVSVRPTASPPGSTPGGALSSQGGA